MNEEQAECGNLTQLMQQLGGYLDQYLRFEHTDAMHNPDQWKAALGGPLPTTGTGIDAVMADMGQHLIPNGSQIPNPGCSSFITTGATSIGALATMAGSIAAPQRIGLTAFNYLEQVSLQWMAQLFELPPQMRGIYSSGGSVANLVALGAARQSAFEAIGIDPALHGVQQPCCIYASEACHHTVHRAAAVLGLGRASVVAIATDADGRMRPDSLLQALAHEAATDRLPVAIVASAGTTGTGAIDPLQALGEIAQAHNIWFHIDGAYGLPGILDPTVTARYRGLCLAHSVTVDPHKWLGAPVGIGATYVRDYDLLQRSFTQGATDYLEGSESEGAVKNSMDSLGLPYNDLGVELSAPPRGAVVWALIREIGKDGLRARVCRHNLMARYIADQAQANDKLELLLQPQLSICCFRYAPGQHEHLANKKLSNDALNTLNRKIHRQLVHHGKNMPSTAMVGSSLAIRPCFVGARTGSQYAADLVDEVIQIGDQLIAEQVY
jgi:aromatic-L-amino-acid decarboxylase